MTDRSILDYPNYTRALDEGDSGREYIMKGRPTGPYPSGELRQALARALEPVSGGKRLRRRSGAKPAAVLVALFEREHRLEILYTRRSDHLLSHQGQVAFPGGRFDPRDRDLLETALREAREEVGVDRGEVEVLGRLPSFSTRITGFSVTPFVGVIACSDGLQADPREVAEIFSVPLEVLRDPRFRGEHRLERDGKAASFPAIVYGGQTIWGLTLRITEDLLKVLDRAGV